MFKQLFSGDINAEKFGASEDESPEMDHSEDSENGTSALRQVCPKRLC